MSRPYPELGSMSLLIAAAVAAMSACTHSGFLGQQPGEPEGQRAADVAPPLKTVAERSDYRATATYDEVRSFLKDLAAASPLVRLSDIGLSGEKREIPLVIVADPPVATPEEAKKSGKLVVAMLGGIHSGECDGKEALLALARDLSAAKPEGEGKEGGKGLLDSVILAFIPIYNPDGNEKMDPKNRQGQVGPETMGRRENAAGLDLNRDFVKLEAPETRALLKFINAWDPAVLIDTHTTNGSLHRYPLTYDTNKNPAGDAALLEFTRKTMMPEIARATKERHGLETFWYGNFENNHGAWEAYPDEPRYGINYFGMRNRVAVLTESYSYAPYKERIVAQLAFVREVLGYVAAHKDEIKKLIAAADKAAAAPAGEGEKEGRAIAIRTKQTAGEEKVPVLGFVEETRDGRRVAGEPKVYEVDLRATFVPEKTVEKPYAYIIEAGARDETGETPAVVQALQRHGIKVEELREDLELTLTAAAIDAVTKASRPFQGHSLVAVKTTPREVNKRVPAGSYMVKTAQPLGDLACYLLEPESADGLTTWNFFDADLKIGGDLGVYRLEKRAPAATLPAADLPEARKPKEKITYALVHESDRAPNLGGSPVGVGAWLDGEHFLQNKEGKLWKVRAATGKAERFFDPGPIAAALEKLPTISKREAEGIANRGSFSWDKARKAFVLEHRNDLYYCAMDGSVAKRLTSTPAAEELWSFSPNGEFVSFVRANDLWVVDVATGTERALTSGGTDTLRNGKADWVYYEEIFNRGQTTYWWSPDSTRIAYFQIDSSPIKVYTLVNDIPEGLAVEETRYPKVGQPNPVAKLFTVNVAGGDPEEVDLSAYTPQDMLILNCGWYPDSSAFLAFISNRTQTWLDVLKCPADGGEPTKLFRETTKAWVEPPPPPKFLKDGSFLFQSERTGWMHFYRYGADGKLIKQVTEGEWEARSIVELDEDNGWLYIRGTKDNPVAENLYRVKMDGSGFARLTNAPGSHRVDVSPDGVYFVDSWSAVDHPTRVALFKSEDGSLVRTLDTNPVRDLDRYILGSYERVQIPTPDGFVLEGSILKPADFDPNRKHPVWFQTYGGPHAPTVSDSWQRRNFDEYLATDGFIVFHADPRSASGKGAVSTWTAYKQLGIQELADIETAITWLSKNPWVDAARIGMAGHSYGGFMTSFCLTHSKLFAAGIAGAPVTDWRDYDSVYTERYMSLPQDNPEGYDKTSVVKAAKDLNGRLLILHGMIDDNVHPQNSTRLMRALQRAGKQFEVMFYPEARHGVGGKHYNRLVYEFIIRNLGKPAEAPSEPATGSPAASN